LHLSASQDLEGAQWVSEDTLVAAPTNSAKLEIFDVRTQKWSDLVPGKVPGSVVNWAHSPDYQYVYYTTGGAEPQAMRIRLADRKVETIAGFERSPPCARPGRKHPNQRCPRRLGDFHPRRRHAGDLCAKPQMAVSEKPKEEVCLTFLY